MSDHWNVADIELGDFVCVRVVNKLGDSNLDGTLLEGVVKELVPTHNMVRLESGWCCHTKDELVRHRRASLDERLAWLRKAGDDLIDTAKRKAIAP